MSRCEDFLYTTADSVKVRLGNKVQFPRGREAESDEISNSLLAQLIRDAESDVELALSSRYYVPFQTVNGGRFDALADHVKRQIRMVVDLRAVYKILMHDFGRGTHVEGEAYSGPSSREYDQAIKALLGQEKAPTTDQTQRSRMSPPLPGLRLATTNRADNGVFGKAINTDAGRNDLSSYAANQTNDPSRTFLPRGGGSRGLR